MRLLAVEARQNGIYNLDRYRQAESLGADLYVLNGEGDPEFWPAGRYRLVGSKHLDRIVAAALDWHAQLQFDGVLTFAESALVTAAAIAEAAGLPGIGVRAALTSRNKLLMHEAHQAAGAPVARFRYAPDLISGIAAAEDFGYPVVIKPALGASSNFVFRADSPASFARCYSEAARGAPTMKWALMEAGGIDLGPPGLVVESYLDGSEHLIEALAWDGDVQLASVVDRVAAAQVTFEENVHQAPTSLSAQQVELIRTAIAAAVRGQAISRSVLHAEIRFHRGVPHVLEVTPKPGGGGLEHMARVSAGYCPITAHLQVATGRRPRLAGYRPTGVYTAARALLCKAGQLIDVVVPDEVTAAPELLFCRIVATPGDVLKRPPDGNGILGFLGATGPTRRAAMNAAERLAKLVSATVIS